MVHALEKVHSLLKPDGLLIDIHPTGEPPPIEVHNDARVTHAGWLRETDDFVEYFQADEALAEVIRRGLFTLERSGQFTFLNYADTIIELDDHLKAEWSDAILEEDTIQRAEELLAEPGRHKTIILREEVHISRLRPG